MMIPRSQERQVKDKDSDADDDPFTSKYMEDKCSNSRFFQAIKYTASAYVKSKKAQMVSLRRYSIL